MTDYDIGLGKYYCTDCDWIGEFAKLTDKSRDTDSLVEYCGFAWRSHHVDAFATRSRHCPECGSVDLEIGGGL